MGWALVPISWFCTENKRYFSDITTYKRIDNCDISNTVTNYNTLLNKLQLRFSTIISNHNQRLLGPTPQDQLHLPHMKLLPKVHKLDRPASHNNITELTGRPIITAHSWTTSNASRLLGTELDNTILRDIIFPLIYNSTDFLNLLENNTSLTWTTFVLRPLTLPHSTPTSLTMTLSTLSLRAANCLTCLFFIGIICLTLITLLTNPNFFCCW